MKSVTAHSSSSCRSSVFSLILLDEVEDGLGPAVDGEPGAVGDALLRARDVYDVALSLRMTRAIGTLFVRDDDNSLALREVLVNGPDGASEQGARRPSHGVEGCVHTEAASGRDLDELVGEGEDAAAFGLLSQDHAEGSCGLEASDLTLRAYNLVH